jgi:hypothetical protein
MSSIPAPASFPSAAPSPAMKPGQVLVIGRLASCKRPAGSQWFINLVTMPAPDAYSSPSTVEILSKNRLGDPEQDVRILCRLGGFKRQYKATDRETGEIRTVQTSDNKLYAVED